MLHPSTSGASAADVAAARGTVGLVLEPALHAVAVEEVHAGERDHRVVDAVLVETNRTRLRLVRVGRAVAPRHHGGAREVLPAGQLVEARLRHTTRRVWRGISAALLKHVEDLLRVGKEDVDYVKIL